MPTASSNTLAAPDQPVAYLLAASASALILSFLPFAGFITYPFLIFATFIHETSHAIAALLTGGAVQSLVVRWDGSGLTYTRGGLQAIVSSAGYVGTAIFGGFLLILSRNRKLVRPVLAGCALLVATVTAFFVGYANNFLVLAGIISIAILLSLGSKAALNRIRWYGAAGLVLVALFAYLMISRSLFSWAVGLFTTVAFLGVFRFAALPFAQFFLSFLAVQCSLNSLEAIKTLYFVSLHASCPSDAKTMAALTGLPALFWALLWACFAITVLILSLIIYCRAPKSTS